MAKDITRRQLRFERLDEAVSDARMLQATGYDRAGTWDLSQVCGHLATGMEFPIDHTGPLHPSPMFGSLDREQLYRLQLIHCAHHLGFLLPRAEMQAASKAGHSKP